ncbi:hypothetical protein AWB89_03835 [Mycobacterium paraense]|nr:hypothetical protein AWB89_03835 [Mycobacterium paraense]
MSCEYRISDLVPPGFDRFALPHAGVSEFFEICIPAASGIGKSVKTIYDLVHNWACRSFIAKFQLPCCADLICGIGKRGELVSKLSNYALIRQSATIRNSSIGYQDQLGESFQAY